MSWQTVGFTRMCLDWLKDPQRVKHVIWRAVQCYVGWLVGWACLLWFAGIWVWQAWAIGLGLGLISVLANFLVFEFVLEPLGLLGPYWEGGPEDGKPYTHW
jgi:hypothetical protein